MASKCALSSSEGVEDAVAMGFRPWQVGVGTYCGRLAIESTQLEAGWFWYSRPDVMVTQWSYRDCGQQPGLLCPHMAHNQHWPLAPTLSQSLTSETVPGSISTQGDAIRCRTCCSVLRTTDFIDPLSVSARGTRSVPRNVHIHKGTSHPPNHSALPPRTHTPAQRIQAFSPSFCRL